MDVPLAFATCSIGSTPSDTLPVKLEAIRAAGYQAVEMSLPDVVDYASHLASHQVEPDSFAELLPAAAEIHRLCDALALKVMMLQPLGTFEGWPRGSAERKEAFARTIGWMEIMQAVGTDLLQVGSSNAPAEQITTDRTSILDDLRALADMLAARKMRLAYENWCWSTHAPTWKAVWDIVRDVDRPNVGLCLDTFQIAGSEWADPSTASGLREPADQPFSEAELQAQFRASLDELTRCVPADRIYVLQISDAYKPQSQLRPQQLARYTAVDGSSSSGLRPKERWSHDFRPMPYDGGYLPVEEVARAVLQTGFRGWVSMEIFDGGPDGRGRKYDVFEYAKQSMQHMQRLLGRLGIRSQTGWQ